MNRRTFPSLGAAAERSVRIDHPVFRGLVEAGGNWAALLAASDGKLSGVGGGDDDEMARLFSYDPPRGTYELLGLVDVNRQPYYSWQAYRIGAVVAGKDGTLRLGQSERRFKLYLYDPE